MSDTQKNEETGLEEKSTQTAAPEEEHTEAANEPDVEVETESAEAVLEAKLKDAEERYIRVHADFENVKKRLEREKYDAIDYAQEKFAKDLLPVADALDAALKIDDKEQFEQLKEGVKLTLDTLIKAFEKHGIAKVEHEGGFDPNKHEAVMQVPSEEHESGHVVEVLQQGYRYRDRILRPSLVSVSQ